MTPRKLTLKEKYRLLTRDLDWDFSYVDHKDVFPYEEFEGIKITDWDKWEDPFRLTMDAYWKYQAEKEKKLYAIFDAFAQNNGQQNVADAVCGRRPGHVPALSELSAASRPSRSTRLSKVGIRNRPCID